MYIFACMPRPGGSKTQTIKLTRVKIKQSGPAAPPAKARPESKSITGLLPKPDTLTLNLPP